MTTFTTETYIIGQTISGTFSKLPFTGTIVGYSGVCLKVQVESPVRNLPVCTDLISKLPNILIVEPGAINVMIEQAPVPAAPVITYRVAYDRATHDYACLVSIGGEPEQYIGSTETYLDGERKCRDYKHDLLTSDLFQSAAALDGGSNPDEIAAEHAENLTTAIHLDGQTTTRQHVSPAKRDEYLRYNPSARIVDVAALPIANFRPTIVGPLWDQGYTSPNLPNNARDFRFTVDACPVCQRLLNHSIYANAAGAWLAYDWCLECDRGRIAGQSCSGMQFPCNRPATQHIYSNATGMMHLCDEHAAEWQSYGPDDDQPTTAPGHNLITPDPAECPDISALWPVEDLSACERYSTPPLALWGPDTPECSRCGTRHDPIVGCSEHSVRPAELGSPIEDCLCPRCTNCDKPHHIQRCPEVWRALLG